MTPVSHSHLRIVGKKQGVNVIAFGHLPGIEQPVCVVGGNCSVQAGGSNCRGLGSWPFLARATITFYERELVVFVVFCSEREIFFFKLQHRWLIL